MRGVVTLENERFRINKNCSFPGVYIILNIDNKKVYIGSTRNIYRRLVEHEISVRSGRHNSKELQADYNAGDYFIGYPITRVELLENKYQADDNLRYFESIAIEYFKANNPQKGYNKRLDEKVSPEINNIKWSKTFIDDYFYHKESLTTSSGSKKEYSEEEMQDFINKRLE